jgi:hypothetical protein
MKTPSSIQIFFFAFLVGLTGLFSCDQKPEVLTEVQNELPDYSKLGDSISFAAQQELLKNVAIAMNEGDPEYAVNFCNTHASRLTDSISSIYNVRISRISDKNRNPNNKPNKEEELLFQRFKTGLKDTLLISKKEQIYYKAIHIGMPACLKCHGSEEEINKGTKAILKEKYPQDLATGYKQGDLRGAWKLVFTD